MSLLLPPPPNFNFQAVLMSHGWRHLRPFRWDADSPGTLFYTLRLPTERVVTLRLTDGIRVEADLDLTPDETHAVRRAVRSMLMLDVDLSAFYLTIAVERRYDWVREGGAGRLLTAPTVWEDLVKTLLTTNVSWSNTVNMVARLCDYGSVAADGSHAFPTPEQILAQDAQTLNAHVRAGYRVTSLMELAEAVVSGQVDVEAWRGPTNDPAARYAAITDLHGFGAYAAGATLRLLGCHDYLGLDSVCRGMFAQQFNGGQKPTDDQIEAFYRDYGAWRGLALWMDVVASD